MSGLNLARRALLGATAALIAAACGGGLTAGDTPPTAADDAASSIEATASDVADPTATETGIDPAVAESGSFSVALDGPTTDIDRRILGTNLPAWLGPVRLRDADFQANALATGTTMVRMPGGSWSNAYDWFACETRDEQNCFWPWAARPSDFAAFMVDTGLAGMWTVSINHTAQAAAATVAFFNGDVDDGRVIGVDRNGFDWGNVGFWAGLRANNGHPDPVRIELWEVGNEVYGGKRSEGGPGCKSWGWEDVWTCDGTEYVTGNANYDGYLATRAAMLAVDATIDIGAVGVPTPKEWGNWGNEVIAGTEGELDFYIVHEYGFESSPDTEAALRQATVIWPEIIRDISAPLGDDIPIAVTEYNLVTAEDRDTERTMTQAVNALYLAESIGQLATLGVSMANQWNLANGMAANGTDYGMINIDDGTRYPQFQALATWSRAGTKLFPAIVPVEGVKIYPTLHDDGRVTLIVVGRSSDAATWSIDVVGMIGGSSITTTTAAATDPTDTDMPTTVSTIEVDGSTFDLTIPAWSILSVEIVPSP